MMQLKSVSGPTHRGGLEAAVAPAAASKVRAGSLGTPTTETSRAAKYWVGRGKSEERVRRATTSSGALETVIGIDDRKPIAETDLPPWRMVCSLTMRGRGGGAIGTGWFVGPRTIITAGHCVFDTHFFGGAGWPDSITVVPGRIGDDGAPFGEAMATTDQLRTLDVWQDSRDPDFDIGCIQLTEDLGETTGWFGLATLPDDELLKSFVNISGYPGDRDYGTIQYFHKNRILRVTERRIFYDVDTFGGQSGAPVWMYRDGEDAPLVVGIHAYGVGGTPAALGVTANSAPRVIPEVFEQIQAWVAEAESA